MAIWIILYLSGYKKPLGTSLLQEVKEIINKNKIVMLSIPWHFSGGQGTLPILYLLGPL